MLLSTDTRQLVFLDGISWDTYERMLEDLGDRPIRLTYDCGRLEIMSPGHRHEGRKTNLGRLIELLALELDLPLECGGSTTWKRASLEKGLEADECYWVQNEARVRDQEVGPEFDPPPDLAVEIDVTTRVIDRLPIYAAIGIPEVWVHRESGLEVLLLSEAGGEYTRSETSRCFPWLPMAEFARWIDRPRGVGATEWMQRFRDWVRTLQPTR